MKDDVFTKPIFHPSGKGEQVLPPSKFLKRGDHHWLEVLDSDGHNFGLVVLQWNPGAQKWSHSGNIATGMYIDTSYWKYHSHCPMPE